nr:FAD-dependent monooxygenase [Sphingomonas jinjuensis]
MIVGGGPAGAAAAITLARAAAPHLLIERTRETGDPLCGGFLSWRSLAALERLGIAAAALNPARIDRVRLIAGDNVREARLPALALAVSRHRLDTLLLAAATQAGAAVERGVTVRAVEGRRVTIDGSDDRPDALLLATGKHEVRGVKRAEVEDDPVLGIRVRLAPTLALTRLAAAAVELHLVDGGYIGVALQEDGAANCCMAVRRSRLHQAGNPAALIEALAREAPHFAERLDASGGPGAIDAVANVPYGWRARVTSPGVFLLGDQAAVIPSLAGEGMGIALASGVAAAQAYLRDGAMASTGWQAGFSRRVARPMAVAGIARQLAERQALHPLVALLPPALIRATARWTRVDAG